MAHGSTDPLPFRPYREDGGHHIPAKSIFGGNINPEGVYNEDTIGAIPNYFMYCCGINHNHNCKVSSPCSISDFQINGYAECKRNGIDITWDVVERVEINALVKQTGLIITGTGINARKVIPISVAKATMKAARLMLDESLKIKYPNQTRVDIGRYYATGLLLGVCPRPR